MNTIVDFVLLVVLVPLFWAMRFFPDRFALALANSLVVIVRTLAPRIDRAARRNLELIFPDKDSRTREHIYRESLSVLARNIVAFSRLPDLKREDVLKSYDFEEYDRVMSKARRDADGKGIIVACIHFGLFEQHVQACAVYDRPFAILARGMGHRRLDRWINGRRELFGSSVFSRKGGYAGIVHNLKQGRDVIVLCDQNVKINHATFVSFFGIAAATTKAIGLASIRTKSPLVFGVGVETSPGKFRIMARRIMAPAPKSGAISRDVDGLMEELHRAIEDVIRCYPQQWLWTHRRFKTRPPGEPETIYS